MPSTKTNWEILAVTRFFLAFVVLSVHLSSRDNTHFLDRLSNFGGFEAVLGFLLISGFSIGKSISRNKESYFKRRLARIYPVYIAALATAIVVTHPSFNGATDLNIAFNLLFLIQVFTTASFNMPTWTLALEVWLYATAPLLLKATFKQLNILIWLSFIAYIIYTCGRTLYHWPYYFGTHYGINLILLAFGWIMGFAIAIFPERERFNKINVAAIYIAHIALTAGIAAMYSYKHHDLAKFLQQDVVGFVAKAVCLTWVYLVVLYNYKFKEVTGWVAKLFDTLGNISYPLYLVHSVTFLCFNNNNYRFGPVMAIAAVFYSWIVYMVFDFYTKKTTRRKRRRS